MGAAEDQFTERYIKLGGHIKTARAIIRLYRVIDRLNGAECNGDYPATGDSTSKPCTKCQAGYAPESLDEHGVCPNCLAQEKIRALVAADLQRSYTLEFQGDPRGRQVIITSRLKGIEASL